VENFTPHQFNVRSVVFIAALAVLAAIAGVTYSFSASASNWQVCVAELHPSAEYADKKFDGNFNSWVRGKRGNSALVAVKLNTLDASGIVQSGDHLDLIVKRGTASLFFRANAITLRRGPAKTLVGRFFLLLDQTFPSAEVPRIADTVKVGKNLQDPVAAVVLLQGQVTNVRNCEFGRVTEPVSGVSLDIPPGLVARNGEDEIRLVDPGSVIPHPAWTVSFIDVSLDTALLPHSDALEQIARDRLGGDFVEVVGFGHDGVEVRAIGMIQRHFFLYNPGANKAVQISPGGIESFQIPEFVQLIDSLEF